MSVRVAERATPALNWLVCWFLNEALPNWAARGFDERNGQFVEALQLDGSPISDPIVRVRSAARQIYVFADAARLGVAKPDYLDVAEQAFANLHSAAWIGGTRPGYARTIDRAARSAADETRDLYDNACVLLALAALYAATDRITYRHQIENLLAAIDTTLADPAGGWAEDDRSTLPRRQNPHMHLFEACLVLTMKTRDTSHRRRLDALYALFLEQFYNRGAGPLCEFFGPTWEKGPEFRSERLDPGHMCEWTWLLRRYSDAFGVPTNTTEQNLLDTARRIGGAGGILLVDEVSEVGEPLTSSRRLWLQTEFLKALVSRFEATGEHRYLGAADMVALALQDTYLSHTPSGTWRDNFDLNGRCIADRIPSSSLYHTWTAVAELC